MQLSTQEIQTLAWRNITIKFDKDTFSFIDNSSEQKDFETLRLIRKIADNCKYDPLLMLQAIDKAALIEISKADLEYNFGVVTLPYKQLSIKAKINAGQLELKIDIEFDREIQLIYGKSNTYSYYSDYSPYLDTMINFIKKEGRLVDNQFEVDAAKFVEFYNQAMPILIEENLHYVTDELLEDFQIYVACIKCGISDAEIIQEVNKAISKINANESIKLKCA